MTILDAEKEQYSVKDSSPIEHGVLSTKTFRGKAVGRGGISLKSINSYDSLRLESTAAKKQEWRRKISASISKTIPPPPIVVIQSKKTQQNSNKGKNERYGVVERSEHAQHTSNESGKERLDVPAIDHFNVTDSPWTPDGSKLELKHVPTQLAGDGDPRERTSISSYQLGVPAVIVVKTQRLERARKVEERGGTPSAKSEKKHKTMESSLVTHYVEDLNSAQEKFRMTIKEQQTKSYSHTKPKHESEAKESVNDIELEQKWEYDSTKESKRFAIEQQQQMEHIEQKGQQQQKGTEEQCDPFFIERGIPRWVVVTTFNTAWAENDEERWAGKGRVSNKSQSVKSSIGCEKGPRKCQTKEKTLTKGTPIGMIITVEQCMGECCAEAIANHMSKIEEPVHEMVLVQREFEHTAPSDRVQECIQIEGEPQNRIGTLKTKVHQQRGDEPLPNEASMADTNTKPNTDIGILHSFQKDRRSRKHKSRSKLSGQNNSKNLQLHSIEALEFKSNKTERKKKNGFSSKLIKSSEKGDKKQTVLTGFHSIKQISSSTLNTASTEGFTDSAQSNEDASKI